MRLSAFRLLGIGIRQALLVLSIAGWITFVVGFVQLNKRVHIYYANSDFPEFTKQFLHLANTLFIPMWVFVASGVATYITFELHIIVCHEKIKHILHSILMFFNVLYMFGGSGTLIIALAFSLKNTAKQLQGLVHLDEESAKIVLYGGSLAVGMYWLSTVIWPLLEIKGRREREYFPVGQVSIQDDESWVKDPPRRFGSNSGRFSRSRELYQQVSQEEIDYEWTSD